MVDNELLISKRIYLVRGQKVMLDFDLAKLYEVETKRLSEAVKRNISRFPEDFSFYLTEEESLNLRSQFATSSFTAKYGGRRYKIRAFTEHGVTMLSSVLKSNKAIQINIQIVRMFIRLRELLLSHRELNEKISKLEKKYDGQFELVFKALRHMLEEEQKPKERLGFRTE